MPWLYILKCADGSYYVGSTIDLIRRLVQHDRGGGCKYTATRRPVELVYKCEFASIRQAFEREHQVKGWRREKKEALIRGECDLLQELAASGEQEPQRAAEER